MGYFLVVGGFVSVEEEAVKESFILLMDWLAVDVGIIVVALSLFAVRLSACSLCNAIL